MKIDFRKLNSKFSYLLVTAFLVSILSSCVVETTSAPYVDGQTPGPQIKTPKKKKKSNSIFKKKIGDASTDFRKDNRDGQLILKQYGAPGPLTPYYNKLLTEDLGVKIEIIGDGIVSGELLRYAKEYNALMTAEIERKYGPGILNVARRKAQIMAAQVERGKIEQ